MRVARVAVIAVVATCERDNGPFAGLDAEPQREAIPPPRREEGPHGPSDDASPRRNVALNERGVDLYGLRSRAVSARCTKQRRDLIDGREDRREAALRRVLVSAIVNVWALLVWKIKSPAAERAPLLFAAVSFN